MKKLILAAVLAAACVIIAPSTVKADAALDVANNFNNVQQNWLNQQWNYYNTYQQPVLTVYNQAIANQYSQALAASFQANVMAQQAQQRAAANNFQLYANEYAHQQNLATQYYNMKNNLSYNMINTMDQSYYNSQEWVLRSSAAMLGQVPFPQVQ